MDVDRARAIIAAEKPRRLRLDELLRELGADDKRAERSAGRPDGDGMPTDAAASGELRTSQMGSAGDRVSLDPASSGELRAALARRGGVTIGELVEKAGGAAFGFVIGVLALVAIPFFGLSTPFGLVIALIGASLAIGKQRPWLPARVLRRQLSMTMLDRVLRLVTKRTRWLARSTKRRWEPLITPRLIGFAVTLLGLGLALPLPIPGSNMIFIAPILVYAIALLEFDGLWCAIGHACTLIDLALLGMFGATVVAVLESVWQWIT
jgi:hypothetical protein